MAGQDSSLLPPKKNPPLLHSFAYALAGIGTAFSRERNLRIHAGVAAGAVYIGAVCGLSSLEWAVLLVTIGFVAACELLNSAMEHLSDLAVPGQLHPLAKAAKDMAAGAVLIAALASLGVGVCLFGNAQRLSVLWAAISRNPLPLLLLAAAALLFILLPCRKNGAAPLPPTK